jgi:hypothetical protein
MNLEQRVTTLEKEVAELKRQLEERPAVDINVLNKAISDAMNFAAHTP